MAFATVFRQEIYQLIFAGLGNLFQAAESDGAQEEDDIGRSSQGRRRENIRPGATTKSAEEEIIAVNMNSPKILTILCTIELHSEDYRFLMGFG